ncbi:predicted protein, partial [Nematostella vectensis]
MAGGYEGVHGGYGYGERNPEGVRQLDFAVANELVITNSMFQKKSSHLVTYQSGGASTQVDYILTRKNNFRHVTNTKVVPNEECALQHKLVICDTFLKFSKKRRQVFTPRLRVWKLRDPGIKVKFLNEVKAGLDSADARTDPIEDTWQSLKGSLMGASEKICGYTKKGNWRNQTWWWDDSVSPAIDEKRRLWKVWKKGGSKQEYLTSKRTAKSIVRAAKRKAEASKFASVEKDDKDVFRIAMENGEGVQGRCG